MTRYKLLPDLTLLLTAAIWGFAFIAQRSGMQSMGPFTFNAVRFLAGALILWLFTRLFPNLLSSTSADSENVKPVSVVMLGLLTGIVLFGGASLQQIGLVHTEAGKAGFITGMYVVLVPILGLFIGKRTNMANWLGAVLAAGGLFLLTVNGALQIARSDTLVLIGALVWAIHVHLIGSFSPKIGAVRLAIMQFVVCGVLSLAAAFAFEAPTWSQLQAGGVQLLYASFLSVALAYTLQVVAQQWAEPTHAAVILSLEGAFAALGGWLLLREQLGWRGLIGAAIMLLGMLVSQGLLQKKEISQL